MEGWGEGWGWGRCWRDKWTVVRCQVGVVLGSGHLSNLLGLKTAFLSVVKFCLWAVSFCTSSYHIFHYFLQVSPQFHSLYTSAYIYMSFHPFHFPQWSLTAGRMEYFRLGVRRPGFRFHNVIWIILAKLTNFPGFLFLHLSREGSHVFTWSLGGSSGMRISQVSSRGDSGWSGCAAQALTLPVLQALLCLQELGGRALSSPALPQCPVLRAH